MGREKGGGGGAALALNCCANPGLLQIAFINNEELWIVVDSADLKPDNNNPMEEAGIGVPFPLPPSHTKKTFHAQLPLQDLVGVVTVHPSRSNW